MTAVAQYHGTCPECEQPIMPGERITRHHPDDAWEHLHCGEIPARVECVCERCFLVHAGECF